MKLQAMVFAGLLACAGSANAGVLYAQPWDGGSNFYASQNDTNGVGNFATTYDQFTLSSSSDVEDLEWTGGYFNPPNQALITAWTITFYADNAGAPGAVLTTLNFTNTGNETFVADVNGFPIYTYSETFPSYDLAAGTYFVSVVPDLGFPPQWGWATGTGGTSSAYQCFFGSCGSTNVSMAFDVTGSAIPEPSTWVMMVAGFAGLGFAAFRGRRSAVAVA